MVLARVSRCVYDLLVLFMPKHRYTSICTCLFGIGPPLLKQQLTVASSNCMARFSPDMFYCLVDRFASISSRLHAMQSANKTASFTATATSLTVPACLALLRLAHFDPGTFVTLSSSMQRRAKVEPVSPELAAKIVEVGLIVPLCLTTCLGMRVSQLPKECLGDVFLQAMNKVVARYFVVNPSDAHDAIVEVARLLYCLGDDHLE